MSNLYWRGRRHPGRVLPLLLVLGALLACKKSKKVEVDRVETTGAKTRVKARVNPNASKVDPLTASSVQSKLGKQYKHRGFRLMKQQNIGGDWIGTVMIGKQRVNSLDLAIYRVLLANVSSSKEGYARAAKLRKAAGRSPVSVTVGDKKLLLISCVGYRKGNRVGVPGSCAGKNPSGPRDISRAIIGR